MCDGGGRQPVIAVPALLVDQDEVGPDKTGEMPAPGLRRDASDPRQFVCRQRAAVQEKYKLPPAWFSEQPRVTAKTGWITQAADPVLFRRCEMQQAAAELAIHVARCLVALTAELPCRN